MIAIPLYVQRYHVTICHSCCSCLADTRYCMILFVVWQAHEGNCPLEVVWCENKCGARIQNRYLHNHMKNECHKRTVSCPYCLKQFVFETLNVSSVLITPKSPPLECTTSS